MKDFFRVLLILVIAIIIPGIIVFMGFSLAYWQFALIWIIISTIGIVFFILFGPGRRHHPDKDKRKL